MKGLSRQEVAALQEGDEMLVRMVVRKPLGEFGTVHCRIHDEKTWRSHADLNPGRPLAGKRLLASRQPAS